MYVIGLFPQFIQLWVIYSIVQPPQVVSSQQAHLHLV